MYSMKVCKEEFVYVLCRYTAAVVSDGTANQASNPEVTTIGVQGNTVINNQILQLRLVTTKLKNAYNGLDVDSIDMGMISCVVYND